MEIDKSFRYERKSKYNDWGMREPLVCNDQKIWHGAIRKTSGMKMTDEVKSTIYLNALTGCKGFEFVATSNSKLPKPVCLPNNIFIYPCFLQSTEGMKVDDPLVQATMQMEHKHLFIYDGWVPIESMEIETIVHRINELRNSLAIYGLITETKFNWQPKYNVGSSDKNTYFFTDGEFETIADLGKVINDLNDKDRNALNRSIGWLSESRIHQDEKSEFLFCVLAIESLCTYIEESADVNSIFYKLKTEKKTKPERREDREKCIASTLEKYSDNITKGVQEAYFNCITGIKKRLRTHLYNLFGTEDEFVNDFFESKNEMTSLYELRHFIAHGNMNALKESDIKRISENRYAMSKLTSRYIWKIFHEVFGVYNHTDRIQASMGLMGGSQIISNRKMYTGPVDICLVYK